MQLAIILLGIGKRCHPFGIIHLGMDGGVLAICVPWPSEQSKINK